MSSTSMRRKAAKTAFAEERRENRPLQAWVIDLRADAPLKRTDQPGLCQLHIGAALVQPKPAGLSRKASHDANGHPEAVR
jgi:hypothetical protein